MIVRHIRTESDGKEPPLEMDFEPGLNLLPEKHAKMLFAALYTVLGLRQPADDPAVLKKAMCIRAEIVLDEGPVTVEAKVDPGKRTVIRVTEENGSDYQKAVHTSFRNKEEEDLAYFQFGKGRRYSDLFKRYQEAGYTKSRLVAGTGGVAGTESFRKMFADHMKMDFPETPGADAIHSTTNEKGENGKGISEEELTEFRFFLSLNRFWRRVEAIRNLHYECLPLFITGIPGLPTGTEPAPGWLLETVDSDRQVFAAGSIS